MFYKVEQLVLQPHRFGEAVSNGKPSCEDCLHKTICGSLGELPRHLTNNRLINDNPTGNYSALLNFAFVKDKKVILRFANNKENLDVCDYVAYHAQKGCKVSAREVLDGACLECDDSFVHWGLPISYQYKQLN